MSHLAPCPSCQRHVRASDAACPFCGAATVVPGGGASALSGLRGRLSRAALFAAGATLIGMSACTDSKCADLSCTGAGGFGGGGAAGASGTGGTSAGGTTGQAGGGGTNDAGTDAVTPTDGPVAIYSAVFPPQT